MVENNFEKLFGKNYELVEFRKKQVLEGAFGIIRRSYKDKPNKMEMIAKLFGKELGEEIGLSETQICNRMAGRSRWTLEEIWELDRVLQFTDVEKLMLIGGAK